MEMKKDPLEAVIRPIVEGQLKSFANDHPECLMGAPWYGGKKDKKMIFVDSAAKRIVNDLLCSENRVRLVQALRAEEGSAATPRGADG